MKDGTLLTPLSIILAFIGVIEATLAYRVTQLEGTSQMIFVWFMVGFPTLVLAGFFYVQLTAPLSWYPPSELDKTNIEKLQFLGRQNDSLVTIELLGGGEDAKSRTIATLSSKIGEALALYNRGDYETALKLFQEVETAQTEDNSAQAQVSAAKNLVNIGVTLSSMGRLNEAEKALKDALSVYEEFYGPEHPNTAVVLNNLGSVYRNMGRLAEAEGVYRRVLQLQETAFGSAHPDTAAALNNLASTYVDSGRFAEAEPLLKRAIELNNRVLGDSHPQTLSAMNNLAFLYQAMGNYDKSLNLYTKSLEGSSKVLGDNHPTTKLIRENIKKLEGHKDG
jgi:tetratricopeptide (TPR) repeat protein